MSLIKNYLSFYRSASLRVRGLTGPRVTFSDTHTMCRYGNYISKVVHKIY